jgi:hypothetical protein
VAGSPCSFAEVNSNANEGDIIIIPNDTYTDDGDGGVSDFSITIAGVDDSCSDTRDTADMVVFQAETPGSVIFDGNTYLQNATDCVQFKDFYYLNTYGNYAFRTADTSKVRFNNNKLEGGGGAAQGDFIRVINCDDCEFDHNLILDYEGLHSLGGKGRVFGIDVASNNPHLHHNHWDGVTDGGVDNDVEAIEIGHDLYSYTDTSAIIEFNIFEGVISDPAEAISNKISGATYRHNVFIDSAPFTFRLGNDNIFNSNWIFSPSQGYGIRIGWSGNKVINTYIEVPPDGTGIGASMWTSNGTPWTGTDLVFLNNTFIATYPISSAFQHCDADAGATGTIWKNNIIYMTSTGSAVRCYDDSVTWTDNLHYIDNGGSYWTDIGPPGVCDTKPSAPDITEATPNFTTANYNGYTVYVLQASSINAVDAGTADTTPEVDYDYTYDVRDTIDIGADEYIAGSCLTYPPPARTNVGPTWAAGYIPYESLECYSKFRLRIIK